MIDIHLRLFGTFRRYSDDPILRLQLSAPCTVKALRQVIVHELNARKPELSGAELVFQSAIANEQEILQESDEVYSSCTLAILPPVCGG